MMRAVLLTVALLTAGCSSTFYVEKEDHVRMVFGGGGFAGSKIKKYRELAAKGKPVVIDGQMISADAFLAFSLPGACYTENAVFSPHAASYLGLIPSRKHTEWFARKLPDPLETWFKGNIAYYDWIGYAEVDYPQLLDIWPEGACRDGRAVANAGAPGEATPVAKGAETGPAETWPAEIGPPRTVTAGSAGLAAAGPVASQSAL